MKEVLMKENFKFIKKKEANEIYKIRLIEIGITNKKS